MKFSEFFSSNAQELGSTFASSFTTSFIRNIFSINKNRKNINKNNINKKNILKDASILSYNEAVGSAESVLVGFVVSKFLLRGSSNNDNSNSNNSNSSFNSNSLAYKGVKFFLIHFITLIKYGVGYAVKYGVISSGYSLLYSFIINLIF